MPGLASDLRSDIKLVCDMMTRCHYFEQANWLWMAMGSPDLCKGSVAQSALDSAAAIAWEFGFPNVAKWVKERVLVEPLRARAT